MTVTFTETTIDLQISYFTELFVVSAAVITTGYGLTFWGLIPSRSKRLFSNPQRLNRLWGSASIQFSGFRVFFSGIKRPGREPYQSPPFSAELIINGVLYPLLRMPSWLGA
jgi:hypothetical protein